MRAIAAAVLAAGALGLTARADDKPLTRAEVDKRAAKVAHDTILYGTELWQAQNYDGTRRLYEGSLYALKLVLDHRPKLATQIGDALTQSYGMKPEEAAFVLREALDAVRDETDPPKKTAPKEPADKGKAEPKPVDKKVAEVKPLRDRLGGAERVKAIARDVAAAVAADPATRDRPGAPPSPSEFEGKVREVLEQVVVTLLGDESAENPATAVLRRWAATDDQFKAFLGHLRTGLEKNGAGTQDVIDVLERAGKVRAAAKK